ncbi:hypothetical protein JCM6882_001694 [Rhodosporidiobolus microsporus]
MQDALFFGLTAFFAPTVPLAARTAWIENGGVLATQADASSSSGSIDVFVGVKGEEDALVHRLRALGFEVVDQQWIWDSLSQEKLLEKKAYSLAALEEEPKEVLKPTSSSSHGSHEPSKRSQSTSTPPPRPLLQRSTAPSPPTACGSLILDNPRSLQLQIPRRARISSSPSPAPPPTAPAASQAESTSSSGEEADEQVAAYLLSTPARPLHEGHSAFNELTELIPDGAANPSFEPEPSSSRLVPSSPRAQPQSAYPHRQPPFAVSAVPNDLNSPHLTAPASAAVPSSQLLDRLHDASIAFALFSRPPTRLEGFSSPVTVVPAVEVLKALRTLPASTSAATGHGEQQEQASVRSGLREMHHGDGAGFLVRRSVEAPQLEEKKKALDKA